jgi:hypothetical protein
LRRIEALRDLHHIGGRALPEVIGHHPESERSLVHWILAETAHEYLVAALGMKRQG